MSKITAIAVVVTVLAFTSLSAAPGTWTGKIGDSSCGASHGKMAKEGDTKAEKACTDMCILKGAKYIFVNNGKVLTIANQDFKGLKDFAGETVTITGDLKGDTLTVAKLEAAKK